MACAPGAAVPDFRLPALAGGTTDLASLRGRVVLLNFWATWCPPCVEEMPSLERLQPHARSGRARRARRLRGRGRGGAARLRGQRRPDLRRSCAIPGAHTAAAYRTTGYPETFVIDRDGTLRAHVRWVPRSGTRPEALSATSAACFRGAPPPPSAAPRPPGRGSPPPPPGRGARPAAARGPAPRARRSRLLAPAGPAAPTRARDRRPAERPAAARHLREHDLRRARGKSVRPIAPRRPCRPWPRTRARTAPRRAGRPRARARRRGCGRRRRAAAGRPGSRCRRPGQRVRATASRRRGEVHGEPGRPRLLEQPHRDGQVRALVRAGQRSAGRDGRRAAWRCRPRPAAASAPPCRARVHDARAHAGRLLRDGRPRLRRHGPEHGDASAPQHARLLARDGGEGGPEVGLVIAVDGHDRGDRRAPTRSSRPGARPSRPPARPRRPAPARKCRKAAAVSTSK